MTKGFTAFLRRQSIALLALFLALGGTSFAAANLINGSQIKPHTIAKNRLTGSAIRQLHGAKGAQGAPGPAGPQGIQGPIGPSDVYTHPDQSFAHSNTETVTASLSAGTYVVFGKLSVVNHGPDVSEVDCNYPAGPDTSFAIMAAGQGQTITTHWVTTLTSAGSISWNCHKATGTGPDDMGYAWLSAIKVGATHSAGPVSSAPSRRSGRVASQP